MQGLELNTWHKLQDGKDNQRTNVLNISWRLAENTKVMSDSRSLVDLKKS